jgi:hypothetical protein
MVRASVLAVGCIAGASAFAPPLQPSVRPLSGHTALNARWSPPTGYVPARLREAKEVTTEVTAERESSVAAVATPAACAAAEPLGSEAPAAATVLAATELKSAEPAPKSSGPNANKSKRVAPEAVTELASKDAEQEAAAIDAVAAPVVATELKAAEPGPASSGAHADKSKSVAPEAVTELASKDAEKEAAAIDAAAAPVAATELKTAEPGPASSGAHADMLKSEDAPKEESAPVTMTKLESSAESLEAAADAEPSAAPQLAGAGRGAGGESRPQGPGVLRRKREFLQTVAGMGKKDPVAALAAILLLWRMPATLRAARQPDPPSPGDVARQWVRNVRAGLKMAIQASTAKAAAAAHATAAATTAVASAAAAAASGAAAAASSAATSSAAAASTAVASIASASGNLVQQANNGLKKSSKILQAPELFPTQKRDYLSSLTTSTNKRWHTPQGGYVPASRRQTDWTKVSVA